MFCLQNIATASLIVTQRFTKKIHKDSQRKNLKLETSFDFSFSIILSITKIHFRIKHLNFVTIFVEKAKMSPKPNSILFLTQR